MVWISGLGRARARSALGALAVAAVGAALSLGWSAISGATARPENGRPSYFAADRDAGEIVVLDRSLLIVAHWPVDTPVEVESRRGGGAWVACAPAGPAGPHRLQALAADGSLELDRPLGPVFDLDTLESSSALVVAAGANGTRQALLFDPAGSAKVLADAPDLACIAGARTDVAIGTEGGVFDLRVASNGALLHHAVLGGVIADLAPGPEPGTWWALDAHGGPSAHRLFLLEPDLAVRWVKPAGVAALHLAPIAGEERVWLDDANSNFARRFGPSGTVEVAHATLPLSGSDRGLGLEGGGALFAAPGALLALDGDGQISPGQGGFDFLVDVARVLGP